MGEEFTFLPDADLGMQTRLRAIPKQFLVLLKFMERHGDLSRPYKSINYPNRVKTEQLWEEVVQELDSIEGGVKRTREKWKKVWADWKTKTKKKAKMLRHMPNGVPRRQSSNLTNLEKRLLAVMGLATVVTPGNKQIASDHEELQHDSTLVEEQGTIYIHTDNQSGDGENIMFEITPPFAAHSMEGIEETASSSLQQPDSEEPQRETTPARSASPAHSSITATSERGRQGRQQSASPTPSSRPRGRALHKALKQVKTAFQQRTREFANVEHRRLRLEEIRERNEHQRKSEKLRLEEIRERNEHERTSEKLRLESRRLDMEEQRNVIFASIANSLAEILSQNS